MGTSPPAIAKPLCERTIWVQILDLDKKKCLQLLNYIIYIIQSLGVQGDGNAYCQVKRNRYSKGVGAPFFSNAGINYIVCLRSFHVSDMSVRVHAEHKRSEHARAM